MGNLHEGEILICPANHEEQIPLIWTFAFNGAEYWCPYCGQSFGMFYGKYVVTNPELEEKKKKYTEQSKEFLDAQSTFVCQSLEFEGKQISPHDLPEAEKVRLRKIINDWKYEYRNNYEKQ